MITGTIIGTPETLRTLGNKINDVRADLRRTVEMLAPKLAGNVKRKLSDDVLHVRTGRLRRSINYEVREDAHGVFGTVGTNVEYAKFQEFGFKGAESVRAHLRQITQAFGRSILPKQVPIKAHTRNVNHPAHPFLRPALDEMQPEIMAELKGAVDRVNTR
jgi:HK97 gp10 family phage protein